MEIFHLNSLQEVVLVVEVSMEIVQFLCQNSSTDICSDRYLPDLRYADVVVLLSKDPVSSGFFSVA